MISHEFKAEYLNPALWNHLSQVLAPVYARNGKTLHIFRNEKGEYIAEHEAEAVYDRIIIYTKTGIADFYRQIEDMDYLDRSIDDYQIQVCKDLNAAQGIAIIGKERISSLFQMLRAALPQGDFIYLLWIKDDLDQPYFNCILEVSNGQVVRVSTSDRYEPEPVSFASCMENIRKEFSLPVVAKEFYLTEWTAYVLGKEF